MLNFIIVNFKIKKTKKMLANIFLICYTRKVKKLYNDEIEKTIYFIDLLNLYGKLLSHKQEKVMRDYFENDLTITEIGENNNISRQAVYDAITKGQNKLLEYEKKVGAYSEIKKLKGK